MRPRALLASLGALALAGVAVAGPLTGAAHSDGGHGQDLLRAPVAGSLTTDPVIFGVAPGGAPWDLDQGSVRVSRTGEVRLDLSGLLIPGRGVGPVTTVTAALACNGVVVGTTAPAPLSVSGDARIRDRVVVPQRCLAPAVLVNPNGIAGTYIASSGAQR